MMAVKLTPESQPLFPCTTHFHMESIHDLRILDITLLTLQMLRLFSSKAQERNNFCKPSKPCHVGIYWIALAQYSQMSTHVPGFQ